MNQVTCPLAFSIPSCDDTVQDIVTEEKHFIAVDMESGYWKLVSEEDAQEILALFTPDGNRWRKVMPMGDLNSAPTFVSMMMKPQMEWYTLVKERGLKILYKNHC